MNTGVPLSDLKNKFLSEFTDFESNLYEEMKLNRRESIDEFHELGFPTIKNEEWKYTNPSKYIDQTWQQKIGNPKIVPSQFLEQTLEASLEDTPGFGHRFIFIDGQFSSEMSIIMPDEDGLVIHPFYKAIRTEKEIFSKYFGKALPIEPNGFTALNTSFATEGAFIRVEKGKKLKYPVSLIYISGFSNGEKYIHHLRNLIIVEEGGSLELVELWYTEGDIEYLTNHVNEIFAEENAILNHYRFQEEDIETARQVNFTRVVQQKNSLVNNFTITASGKLVRNDLQFLHNDIHCESHLYGLYIGSATQHIDNHTLVDHARPQCLSNEFYKGIMAGQSAGVFNGKVIVRKDAQKTNAYQSNKNILLSDEARINTKPQLEIFANDVKCSHGATTGQLDEEALFYLRSRGIGATEAKIMLTTAFATEILENIKSEEIKNYAGDLVEDKLRSLEDNISFGAIRYRRANPQ